MKYFITCVSVLALLAFSVSSLQAQDRFDRSALIYADTLDVGGFGNVVAGVDFDNDGKKEIYTVNNDWFDQFGLDLTPRIYKYEQNSDGQWEVVWSTRLPLDFQNTWPALAAADLDQDGKWEIVWGPVNNLGGGLQPNPMRIAVFETPGDGSDNMGVQNPDGTWRPNASWTITPDDNVELRPFRWLINDIDSDGTDEIVAACRRGDGIQVYSVDNVPDAADSSETWSLEFSGVTGTFYDIAILDTTIYGIQSNGDVWAVKYDAAGDSFVVSGPQVGLAGRGSWKSAQTVDVDGDGQEEILLASWSSLDNDVYLLQRSGDSLAATVIQDVPSSSFRSYGGAAGDLDSDGMLDFVFGTRSSTPNGVIHRLEYQGGPIDDPASWELTIIDSEVSPALQYDVTAMANLDDDSDDEVLYSGIPRGLALGDTPQPLVILEHVPGNQPIITEVSDVPNDQGRQVWVVWQGSEDDMSMSTPPNGNATMPVAVFGPEEAVFPEVTFNGVKLTPVRASDQPSPETGSVITLYVVWRIDNGLPVQVAEAVAIQSPFYAAVVPTLGDGEEWEATYVVSAHTADPLMNWKSFPKTGTSEDNLIPTAPTNVAASVVNSDVQLTWDESPDPDFNYFSIRRSTQQGFDPTDPATEVGATTDVVFLDSDVQPGETYYYRVVAYDFNGNLGEFSEEVNTTVTGIGDQQTLPKEFALHQNYPNPFNPETHIVFDLPTRADVTITIYNMLGQKIRTLVQDTKEAGTHDIIWNATNDFGVRVASGVYVYTIKAGDFVQSRKMTLLR